MRIFLSHASQDKDIAEQIYLVLRADSHKVFLDRRGLRPADDYNTRIREEVSGCELFVFLVSPDSVAKSSYALTELNYAKEKWDHPARHVLPVMVRETDKALIPNYLKAVTILEPEGDVAAEVARIVKALPRRGGRFLKLPRPYLYLIGMGAVLTILAGLSDRLPGYWPAIPASATPSPAASSPVLTSAESPHAPTGTQIGGTPAPNGKSGPAPTPAAPRQGDDRGREQELERRLQPEPPPEPAPQSPPFGAPQIKVDLQSYTRGENIKDVRVTGGWDCSGGRGCRRTVRVTLEDTEGIRRSQTWVVTYSPAGRVWKMIEARPQ